MSYTKEDYYNIFVLVNAENIDSVNLGREMLNYLTKPQIEEYKFAILHRYLDRVLNEDNYTIPKQKYSYDVNKYLTDYEKPTIESRTNVVKCLYSNSYKHYKKDFENIKELSFINNTFSSDMFNLFFSKEKDFIINSFYNAFQNGYILPNGEYFNQLKRLEEHYYTRINAKEKVFVSKIWLAFNLSELDYISAVYNYLFDADDEIKYDLSIDINAQLKYVSSKMYITKCYEISGNDFHTFLDLVIGTGYRFYGQ